MDKKASDLSIFFHPRFYIKYSHVNII